MAHPVHEASVPRIAVSKRPNEAYGARMRSATSPPTTPTPSSSAQTSRPVSGSTLPRRVLTSVMPQKMPSRSAVNSTTTSGLIPSFRRIVNALCSSLSAVYPVRTERAISKSPGVVMFWCGWGAKSCVAAARPINSSYGSKQWSSRRCGSWAPFEPESQQPFHVFPGR